MSHIADRFVVVLDANVLFPFRKKDILLSFYEAGLFRGRWTMRILDEWQRSLTKRKPHLEQSVVSQIAQMGKTFPEALVVDYEGLIDTVSLPDPDDRHVLAAAIRCGAQLIVTDNLKDFPDALLAPFDLKAISADGFLSQTFELYPYHALPIIREIRARYEMPAYTPAEFLMDLAAKGLPLLAAQLRSKLDLI
ncbi:MAG: PIN domain-containing protein [Pseudomonadota bacterium]